MNASRDAVRVIRHSSPRGQFLSKITENSASATGGTVRAGSCARNCPVLKASQVFPGASRDVAETAAPFLECGDLSPLSLPERLVAQAEPRKHSGLGARPVRTPVTHASFCVRRTAERGAAVTTSRPGKKAATSRRTPHSTLHAPTLNGSSVTPWVSLQRGVHLADAHCANARKYRDD